eukprot:CAMPEP_0117734644 /NCGR_PEP_ID=MMETSP0947-20121206/807_1 /TAXON_ID=44440 /ORGANISM="Chattonella subsalsa, Strain CCMP2191" /LENGTH=542 /DNA_ID=CAMNT_0005549483 /DNA_START=106 /DNA_END=1734 /DNA_ORIENTATION=-
MEPSKQVANGAGQNLTAGVQSVRKLSNSERSRQNSGKKSARQKQRIEEAHTYLAAHVDPIMSQMITFLMIDQPEDAGLAMITYLKKHQAGEQVAAGVNATRLAQRKDRVYMAREVSPLLMKLMNRVIKTKPTQVEAFLIHQLEEMLGMEADQSDAMSVTLQTSMAKLEDGPLTARSSTSLARPEAFGLPPATPTQLQKKELQEVEQPQSGGPPDAKPSTEAVDAQGNQTSHVDPPPAAKERAVRKGPQLIIILVIGIDNSGKTTMMETLQGNMESETKPSHGFKHVTMMLNENLKVKFYDLGGNPRIRGIWKNYYHDVHGILYMVDGNSSERAEESLKEYKDTFDHKYVNGKPQLILINKEDLGLLKSPEEFAADYGVDKIENALVSGMIARGANSNGEPDARMDSTLEWLFDQIQHNWEALDARVTADTEDMKLEFERQKFEKNKKVFRGLLEKAFPKGDEVERENCMEAEEAYDFLAAEIGVEASTLPNIAKEICHHCGYQTLAIQMVGGMKVPISKKNRVWEWEEILQYVNERRQEVNL